jgi:hypothetical protein
MLLAVTICATKSYTYAMSAQARRVATNVIAAKVAPGVIVLVGDTSAELAGIAKVYESVMPEGWRVTLIANPQLAEGGENYKAPAQLLIAAMRGEAFTYCRKIGATRVWSLDSDTIPPANALRCMLNTLEFDAGYYSVATCPYPNTAWLGGFGSPQNPIAEDFLDSERVIPDDVKAEQTANDAEAKALGEAKAQPSAEQRAKWEATRKKIRECPPDGNIWQVTAKHGWRRRGWLDHAYPAIGKGAMLPSDWCGFGCTLLNERALELADFQGYDGQGTEDLFVCWHRWHPAGLRLNVITHCPCDHVIWEKKKGGDAGKYTHHVAYHEPEGECRGHLRTRQIPWASAPTV